MVKKRRAAFTRRLRAGFLLSILLAVITGLLATNAMWSIMRIKDDVTFQEGERLLGAQDIRGRFLGRWTLFRNQWVDPTQENIDLYLKSKNEFETLVAKEISQASPKEIEILKKARDSIQGYDAMLELYWKELEKPKYKEFKEILAKTAKFRSEAENALDSVLESRAQAFTAARKESVHEAERLARVFMLIAALTSLLVLGLLFMMLKTMGRLYQEAQNTIKVNDEFIAIVSHEIKNPIAAIFLQFQLLKKMVTEPKAMKVVHAGTNATKNMTRLLESLMETTRARLGDIVLSPEPGDLCKIVSDCADSFGPQMDIQRRFDCDHVYGLWDESRIYEIVNNLLSNAKKYGKGQPVNLRVWKKGRDAYISVVDHGVGINKNDLDRIFNRFERGTNGNGYKAGMGIGLFVVKEVVGAFGGEVWVESEIGKGSTFTTRLPIKEPPAVPKEGKS